MFVAFGDQFEFSNNFKLTHYTRIQNAERALKTFQISQRSILIIQNPCA
jgi:hypothetical protein